MEQYIYYTYYVANKKFNFLSTSLSLPVFVSIEHVD